MYYINQDDARYVCNKDSCYLCKQKHNYVWIDFLEFFFILDLYLIFILCNIPIDDDYTSCRIYTIDSIPNL